MIAVRIFKKLDQALPSMPELDPLVGKYVQIFVMEEEEPAPEAPPMAAEAAAVAAPVAVAPPVERPVTRRRLRVCGNVDRVGVNGETFRFVPDPESAVA